MKEYVMLEDSEFEPKAKKGTTVFLCHKYDYGAANDDTIITGERHFSMTLDPQGDYPFFTVPAKHLEPTP